MGATGLTLWEAMVTGEKPRMRRLLVRNEKQEAFIRVLLSRPL